MNATFSLALVTFALLSPPPPVGAAGVQDDAGTGAIGRPLAYRIRFRERHALGLIEEQARRYRTTLEHVRTNDPEGDRYLIENESFEVWVPPTYQPEKPHGLFVWISPGSSGEVPRAWEKALTERRLIAVGANDAGNERLLWYRAGLALDAVHNLTRRYSIDPDRVYVAGFSGGGRMASRLTVLYSDVFDGGIYMGGCDIWEHLKKNERESWAGQTPRPTDELLEGARAARHVIFAGDRDFNRDHSHAIYERWKELHFRSVTWLEQPDTDHAPANAEHLARALEALDAPLEKKAGNDPELGPGRTARGMGPPLEDLDDLADRHDQNIEDAEADCDGAAGTLPAGGIQTDWTSNSKDRRYWSDSAYGQSRHDSDVTSLKANNYPPD